MFSTPSLEVNLDAIVANWQMLRARFTGAETAAVVKADAYGLGAIPVAKALAKAGCHSFFVANIEEAIALREALPDVRILVFHGVAPGEEFAFRTHRIIPILDSPEQLARWRPVAAEHRDAVSALQLDTGMHRIGFTPADWDALSPEHFEQARVSLVLSHLTCASDPDHPKNAEQLALFERLSARLQGVPRSLAHSAGILLLDTRYHFDLARPGCALYGIHPAGLSPTTTSNTPPADTCLDEPRACPSSEGRRDAPLLSAAKQIPSIRPVAEWSAPIIQLHTVDRDSTVGYGATREVKAGTVIATVMSGYADGYHRVLGNNAYGVLAGRHVPLLGRVTMDMLSFDVTHVPESQRYESARITLLGADPSVDALAERAGTIGYEILTSIGPRVKRIYAGENA